MCVRPVARGGGSPQERGRLYAEKPGLDLEKPLPGERKQGL